MPICHLQDRSLVRLSGPDVRPFLQGLLTNDIEGLTPDTPVYAGLLSPQGKALFQLFLFVDGEDVLIDVAAPQAEALIKRLTMFRLRREVQITPESALMMWQSFDEISAYPADPRLPEAGSRFPAAGLLPDSPISNWHMHRLPLGLPEAEEIGTDDLLWLETNAGDLNGVSFTKGCYTGQENTARMHHRDKLRKRLLPIHLSTPAAIGTPIMSGAKEAGQIRGETHGGMAMALLKMDYLDQPLTVDDLPAKAIRPVWLDSDPGVSAG